MVGTTTCYSVSYLTLTAGDKGIKCLSASPKQCKRDRQGRHCSPRWQSCQRRLPPRTAGCTAPRHVRLEGSQSDTLVDVLERGHGVVACRGKRLAAVIVLSRPGACRSSGLCRDAWRVGASSLRCLGWPSRQAPLAGVLSPWLGYFVLEWLQRNHGGPWRSPGKPCCGMLRLPVHKFGILGYPYSSTPTPASGGVTSEV